MFTSYWFYGDLQFILSTLENGSYYFFNNYLHIFNVNRDKFEFYFDCDMSILNPYYNCPMLTIEDIERNDIRFDLDYVKNKLDEGWYILVYVDRAKLNAFTEWDRRHQIMIYDYDISNDCVHFCDNDITGKYSTKLTCSGSELLLAYKTIEDDPVITTDWEEKLYLIKKKSDPTYGIDIHRIIESLKKYLKLPPYNLPKDDPYYDEFGGIDTYLGLRKLLSLPYNQWMQKLHNGAFAVLYDHKELLFQMVTTLNEKYALNGDFIKLCGELRDKINRIKLLILKYKVTQSEQVKNVLLARLVDIRDVEQEYLARLVAELEDLCEQQRYQNLI